MFDHKIATATAIYFLRSAGGELNDLQLMKLLYLAEREALRKLGVPIIAAQYTSMRNGPVLVEVYDMMRGEKIDPHWFGHIEFVPYDGTKSNHCVLRSDDLQPEDHLSAAELEILADVWAKVGQKSKWELVDLTHQFPEWDSSVQGANSPGSKRIALEDVLVKGLKMPAEKADETIRALAYYRAL
jgi:uncharacterized phage-associated protein